MPGKLSRRMPRGSARTRQNLKIFWGLCLTRRKIETGAARLHHCASTGVVLGVEAPQLIKSSLEEVCSEYWKCGWRVWRVAGVFRVIRVFELWELEWTAIAGAWRDAASKATEREGRCDSRVAAALRQRSSND